MCVLLRLSLDIGCAAYSNPARSMLLRISLVSFLLFALVACSSQGKWRDLPLNGDGIASRTLEQESTTVSSLPSSGTAAVEAPLLLQKRELLVAPGFEIELKSSDDPSINGKFKVDENGKIRLPYAISLQVAGLTEQQLKETIAGAYAQFFRSPSRIQVSISEARVYVDIGGLVQRPGRYLVKPKASLDELIGIAGGLLTNGDRALMARYARVDQSGQSRFLRLSDYYAGNTEFQGGWYGGERVFLQSEGGAGAGSVEESVGNTAVVQILGSVKNPGEYKFDHRSDFFVYLSKAGGPTAEADLENIEVIRSIQGRRKAKSFSLRKVEQVPEVQVGDIVIVHANSPNYALGNSVGLIGAISAVIVAIFATR